jgi:hypothetical protein
VVTSRFVAIATCANLASRGGSASGVRARERPTTRSTRLRRDADDPADPAVCAECARHPRDGESAADDWRAESDGTGELLVFCPECWQREFG